MAMSDQQKTDIQQLTETVTHLSQAVAAGERRQIAAARATRWFAMAIIVLVGGAVYAASDIIKAYASYGLTAEELQQLQGVKGELFDKSPPDINGIMQSLAVTKELQGTMVKVMQSASFLATKEIASYKQCVKKREELPTEEQRKAKLCFSKAWVEDLGEFYLDANGKLPDPPRPDSSQDDKNAYNKKMMEATIMAAGQVIVDGGALLHRTRRTSDMLRGVVDRVGGIEKLLEGVNYELNQMNGMFKAIPYMATEMHVMNGHMSIMAHGVGTTMGRMGNIMPW
jgi:hypothetical protein